MTNLEEKIGHLVVAVGGGAFAGLYGTAEQSPDEFLTEMRQLYEDSNAESIEFICVDPNTNFAGTNDLDPHEKGFKEPTYSGSGWNAKLYTEGKIAKTARPNTVVASFHLSCGSYSTNENDGQWIHDPLQKDMQSALHNIRNAFSGYSIKAKIYTKAEKIGVVPERLQSLTMTPYNK
jgi:hypothetical protein